MNPLDLFEVNRTRVETLFTDLELAGTFTAVAEASAGEKRKRNIANAKKAVFVITNRLLKLCNPSDSERREIERMLGDLEHRLQRLNAD